MKNYPDIKGIIKNKAAHRRALAALPFEEKLEIVFRLRERRKLIESGQTTKKVPDEMRAEYDFSDGTRGKHSGAKIRIVGARKQQQTDTQAKKKRTPD